MGFTLYGTDKYIESGIHLKFQFALNSIVLQIEKTFCNIIKIVLFVTFDVRTYKACCCRFENAPNTDLLFFEQSM